MRSQAFIVALYFTDERARLPNGKDLSQETVEPGLALSLLFLS